MQKEERQVQVMMEFGIPEEKKVRVILNTDAKNEVDDQFAIVHTVLTEAFDLQGIIAAHFGTQKSAHSMQDSYDEILHVLELLGKKDSVQVFRGAERAMEKEEIPVVSEGAERIVQEAMADDDRPLYAAFLGPLTDMAAALLMEPRIAKKNITVIWIGGGDWPGGGWEYNVGNDVCAVNTVLKSGVQLWQVPRNVYRMMPVTFSELQDKVFPCGAIGKYLVENVIAFNNEGLSRPAEYRILGDSPAVGIMMYPDCGQWEWKPAPELDSQMHYVHTGKNRPIKVYKTMDARFILEDLYAKLRLASR